MDLFASRLSAQLPWYIAWKLDPYSQVTDVMQEIWSNQYLYKVARTLRDLKKYFYGKNKTSYLITGQCL